MKLKGLVGKTFKNVMEIDMELENKFDLEVLKVTELENDFYSFETTKGIIEVFTKSTVYEMTIDAIYMNGEEN